MSLRQTLKDDLKQAMLQRDETRKNTIRLVIAAIQQAETNLDASGARITLEDSDILALIARQIKQREDSIAEFQRGNRPDLVAEEEAERKILLAYLPQQLTRPEIEAEARAVIAELGASGPRDMGKVMKVLIDRLKGRADGRVANQVVREILAAGGGS